MEVLAMLGNFSANFPSPCNSINNHNQIIQKTKRSKVIVDKLKYDKGFNVNILWQTLLVHNLTFL
jgi:hypothetical protein